MNLEMNSDWHLVASEMSWQPHSLYWRQCYSILMENNV